MTQEEKARRYDEAFGRAKAWIENRCMPSDTNRQGVLEDIFPELKESGDELTWLTKYIEEEAYSLSIDIRDNEDRIKLKKLQKALTWLEKQGEKPQGKTALEAINEEKVDNANKVVVEPKFKTGDWIINRTDATIMQIVNNKDFYESIEIGGRRRTDTYNYVEWDFRLWSIEDAKDGDVLVDENNNIGIFEGIEGMCWHSYIYLGCNNRLYGFNIGGSHMQNNTKPATKEQCDLLFSKMEEAGYEWDWWKKRCIKK